MEDTTKLLKTLTLEEKETIYRHVWVEHVIEDIKTYLKDNNETLTDIEIEYAARRYVFDGKYDCNLPYWSNIKTVIDLARD